MNEYHFHSTGQTVPIPAPSMISQVPPPSGIHPGKTAEERERRVNLTKQYAETRKAGRKLVRPRIVKPEEPPADIDMSEADEPNNGGKPLVSQSVESQGNPTLLTQPATRKRLSTLDLQEEAVIAHESNTELSAPLQKKSKGSDSSFEGTESQSSPVVDIPKIPAVETSVDVSSSPLEEGSAGGKDETELVSEQAELSKSDGQNEVELLNEVTVGEEVSAGPSDIAGQDHPSTEVEQDEPLAESGSDREEGEMAADAGDLEGVGSPETEGQYEELEAPVDSPDETVVPVTDDIEAISSPQVGEDSKNEEGEIMEETVEPSDRSTGVTDMAAEQIPTTIDAGVKTSSSTAVTGVTDHGSIVALAHDEANQASPSHNRSPSVEHVSPANKTINITARAKEMSALRQRPQAGEGSTSVARGRGRIVRGRPPPRGFRGRGTSGQQG